ncbi:MAG: RnfH family protein [Betaproteobacteria bacterium]
MTAPATSIRVSVVWATPDVQDVVAVVLPAGATVADAVAASSLPAVHAIDATGIGYGIAGRRVAPSTVLADGDRVELCRSLVVDPGDARRLRARHRPLPKPRPRSKRPSTP